MKLPKPRLVCMHVCHDFQKRGMRSKEQQGCNSFAQPRPLVCRDAGTRVIWDGDGHHWPGTAAGDVVLTVKEIPHSHFRRKGDDLYYTVKVCPMWFVVAVCIRMDVGIGGIGGGVLCSLVRVIEHS